MSQRLDDARARLRSLLLSGGDTSAVRALIAELEAKEQAAVAVPVVDTGREDRIKARATELAGVCRGRVDSLLARFPIPTFERSTTIDG